MTKPNQTRRSLARHIRNRRFELAALATVSAAAACATGPVSDGEKIGTSSEAVITSAQGIAAAQAAINFMVPDAVAFTKANNCLSCHRQPDVLISASIAAQILPGITLDTSTTTGTGFIANLVTGNQASDGHWTDSGSTTSMSAESLWALAGYARAGGSVNVLPNVKKGLLWLVPQASTVTFPSDGKVFAGLSRTYLNSDFVDAPQMFDWYLPTAQSVFATRVLLDLDSTLSSSNVSTLSAQQASYTDALEGSTIRAIGTTTVQHLALTAIAMAESGRASSADGQTIGAQILARQTTSSGWADASSPDGYLQSVNTLTTGQALYALCRLGIRARANAAAGKGLDWLTAQQSGSGSWELDGHNDAVSTSWALLAVACASNPSGTAEFNPLTLNGSPNAPLVENFESDLNITNTSSDARTATVVVTGGPANAQISVSPSSLSLAGDASGKVSLAITLPPGLPPSTSYPFTATVTFTGASGTTSSQVLATFTTAIGATPDPLFTKTTTKWQAGLPSKVDIGSSLSLAAYTLDGNGQPIAAGTVTYTVDGQMITTAVPSGGAYPATWTVPTMTVGSHTLHAAFSGQTGAQIYAVSSADAAILVEPPAPPAPTVSGVSDGSSSTSGQYNLSGHGTPGDTIAIMANGVVVRTATVGSDGNWGASFALSPGQYAISTIETGPGGTSAPTTSHVSVQPTAPTVSGPPSGTTFPSTSMMTSVSGTAAPGATVNVIRGGQVVGTATAGADGSYSIGVPLVAGENDLSVSQTVNGQTSTLSSVSYNQTPVAPAIVYPAPASVNSKVGGLTVTGTTVPGATVLLLDNGVVVSSVTADTLGNYQLPADLSPGENELSVSSSVDGVVSAKSRSVKVRVDYDPPFFPAPPVDLIAWAPTAYGGVAKWPAISAYDAQDGQLSSTCDHREGTMFPLGDTTVKCTAVDSMGNAATTSFIVKGILQVLPEIELPAGKSMTVKSALATGANVSFDVTALNAERQPMAASCSPASGSFFAMGTTKVTCTATDAVAKTSTSSSFDVNVVPETVYVPAAAITPTVTTTPDDASGGCNMGRTNGPADFSALAAVGLALAAARRKRARKGGASCND